MAGTTCCGGGAIWKVDRRKAYAAVRIQVLKACKAHGGLSGSCANGIARSALISGRVSRSAAATGRAKNMTSPLLSFRFA
eukprot:1577560-Rhodomonas_salina.3